MRPAALLNVFDKIDNMPDWLALAIVALGLACLVLTDWRPRGTK